MKKIQGTHIHVCCYADNGKLISLAFARQASVSMKRKMIAISSAQSGDNEECIPGRKSWDMSVGCLLSSDEHAVMQAYNQGKKLFVEFRDETPDWSNELKNCYSGYAYIESLKAQGNIHSMASFNVSLQGTGQIGYGDWDSEDFDVKITGTWKVLPTLLEFKITTDKPLPCDIELQYAISNNTSIFPFKKGETINKKVFVTKTDYAFANWSIRQAVANYNIAPVEGQVGPTPIV